VGPRVSQLLSVAALLVGLGFVASLLVLFGINGRRPVPEETAAAIGWVLFGLAAAFAVFLVVLLAKRGIARARTRATPASRTPDSSDER
jgi:tellurite resistance protein TehA-like permease